MNDGELLQAWATRRSESAFEGLVRRHVDLVHASALRQVREPELARDVTQAVFLILARKAGSLPSSTNLSGWLFRTTAYVSARARRTEIRRQRREQEIFAMNDSSTAAPDAPDGWAEVEPHLDAALISLAAADRDAVLLRYFERLPVREVGARLGLSEESTKKRLQRAVEKLRQFFQRRGVWLTAVGLVGVLGRLPVQAVPAELVSTITQAALAHCTPSVANLVAGGSRDGWWSALRGRIPWATVSLVALISLGWSIQRWQAGRAGGSSGANLAELGGGDSSVAPETNQREPANQLQLVLAVVSATDGQPLPAQVHWETELAGEIQIEGDQLSSPEGRVELDVRTSDFDNLKVWVSAPGHLPILGIWQSHEFVRPLPEEIVRLVQGLELRGRVEDETGKPVEGAVIRMSKGTTEAGRRQSISYHRRLHSLVSDAQGEFRTDRSPALEYQTLVLRVDHPDFVQRSLTIGGTGAPPANPVVVLHRGVWLRGQVVSGAEGNPAPQVPLLGERSVSGEQRRTVANELGFFSLGPFSPGSLKLTVEPSGFIPVSSQVELTQNSREIMVYLPSELPLSDASPKRVTVRLRGSVLDQDSGQPVARFQVRLGGRLLGEGQDGAFDWPVVVEASPQISLEIEADGYHRASTPPRETQEGTEEFQIQLKPGRVIRGQVVDAEGRPMAGVFVGLNAMANETIRLWRIGWNRRTESGGIAQVYTDFDGRFSFPPHDESVSILAVATSGCAQVAVEHLGTRPVVIAPWGGVEGVSLAGGKPVANQVVHLNHEMAADPGVPQGIFFSSTTTTDSNGGFRFDNIPAGSYNLTRKEVSGAPFPSVPIAVRPGEITHANLSGGTRKVVGRIRWSAAPAGFRWDSTDLCLVLPLAPLPQMPPTGEEDPPFRLARAVWDHHSRYFYPLHPEMGPEGDFTFESVPEGDYELQIQVARDATPGNENGILALLARGQFRVAIVADEDPGVDPSPQDLGLIEFNAQE